MHKLRVTGPRGPTEGEPVLDLRAVEARHPATVVLEAGEHHSQDVRERIHAHVDVTALLAHCRALRAALDSLRVEAIRHYEYAGRVSQALLDELERAAAVLAQATDDHA